MLYVKVIMALALTCLFIGFVARIFKSWNRRDVTPSGAIRILDVVSFGARSRLTLIEVLGNKYLVLTESGGESFTKILPLKEQSSNTPPQ